MTTGVIRRVVGDRGFGFVSSNSGRDIFFHYSELSGVQFQALKEGQTLIYRVGLGNKGLIARDVRPWPRQN
jgi:CspA family cold shock protein